MRYPPLDPADMTPRQREVAEAISHRRGQPVSGPNAALLYSPEVADRVDRLGEYLQFNLRAPERLRVLAVLVAAGRHRTRDLAAFIDLQSTQQSGLAPSTIAALAEGRHPPAMEEDEELVHKYCSELVQTGRVKAATFDRAADRLGKDICLELLEVCGYTVFLTIFLNVTETTLPKYG